MNRRLIPTKVILFVSCAQCAVLLTSCGNQNGTRTPVVSPTVVPTVPRLEKVSSAKTTRERIDAISNDIRAIQIELSSARESLVSSIPELKGMSDQLMMLGKTRQRLLDQRVLESDENSKRLPKEIEELAASISRKSHEQMELTKLKAKLRQMSEAVSKVPAKALGKVGEQGDPKAQVEQRLTEVNNRLDVLAAELNLAKEDHGRLFGTLSPTRGAKRKAAFASSPELARLSKEWAAISSNMEVKLAEHLRKMNPRYGELLDREARLIEERKELLRSSAVRPTKTEP